MTPITVNLSPEQSAEADAWTDGASYSLQVTQTAPGQFQATEIGPAEPMPEAEEAPVEEAAAPAAAPAAGANQNPAIAILLGKGKKAA